MRNYEEYEELYGDDIYDDGDEIGMSPWDDAHRRKRRRRKSHSSYEDYYVCEDELFDDDTY